MMHSQERDLEGLRFWCVCFMSNCRRSIALPFFLLFLSFFFVAACGRRGDPVAIIPYKEVGVVKDLKVTLPDDSIHLAWGKPEAENFPDKAIKGFIVFRAAESEGPVTEEYGGEFRAIDYILYVPEKEKTFKYIDKKALKDQSYKYKVIVMDQDNRMGMDSNVVSIKGTAAVTPGRVAAAPEAPTGLAAVYTQKDIVLIWDETRGAEVKSYRIYRSAGNGFVVAGESVTPAFTDRNIEPSKQYIYYITAVGEAESVPSRTIDIMTEMR
ncbi:MAG: fibronectin type III domain-containing protein [Nitrospirae bacterium]|nr:fibronectin type III domain-containing protein [Nitrospirota bacterium]